MRVLLLFQSGFLLFLFLLLSLWLKLPKLCWIVVVRVGILDLFLTLEDMLSIFHHWGKCLLWVYHIWLLLCSGMFLLCLLSGGSFFFNQYCVLNFVKGFLYIYWGNHTDFIFQFVNVVYYVDWFVDIEESLHPWDKAHLVMMYDLLNMLLNSVCENFVKDFCIYVHQWYWPVVFFFCDIFVRFWY